MEVQIAEYKVTAAALSELGSRYKNVVFDVKTPEGMKTAIAGRSELRNLRLNLEKMRVEIKEPVLKQCQLIDSEAKRITNEIVSLELPIDAQIKKEETRKEDIRMAAVRAEAARIAELERLAKEAEEKRLQDERAELLKQQEALRLANLAREELERQSRLKIESELRAARMAIEDEQRAARAKLLAEEDAIRNQREKLAQEAAAIEESKRIERDRQELAARAERQKADEIERKKQAAINAKLDAKKMLEKFMELYSDIKEFETISKAIAEFLKK